MKAILSIGGLVVNILVMLTVGMELEGRIFVKWLSGNGYCFRRFPPHR